MKANDNRDRVQATRRTFKIIQAVYEHEGAGVTELSDELGLAKSTVHNHLSTLLESGYITRDGQRYDLGLRFLQLGNYVQNRNKEYHLVRDKINELAEETGERSQFIVNEHGIGVCVFTAQGENAVHTEPQPGDGVYLHCTSAGKAILAHLDEAQVEEILDEWGMPPLTDQTIVDREELLSELETIREEGIGYNDEETHDGLYGIGTPIISSNGRLIGAISVWGPTYRLRDEDTKQEVKTILLGAKNELEVNIEYV